MRNIKLDWIDALLFAFGFAGAIALSTLLDRLYGLRLTRATLAIAFVPIGIRRLLFGPPTTPEPRKGVLWSMLSIVGLLVVFAGIASLVLASAAAFDKGPPDFEAEARAIHSSADAKLGALAEISFEVVDPNETSQAREARLVRQREARAAEREASIRKMAEESRGRWEEHRRSRIATAWRLVGAGFGLVLLGALMMRARHGKRPEELEVR